MRPFGCHGLHDGRRRRATDTTPRRRVARLRLNRESLSTLVFLLPFLVIFGLFAWFPMLRAVVMSVQETNFAAGSDLRRPRELRARPGRPAVRHRRPEHGLVRGPGPGVRLPGADRPRRADERGPARPRAVQRPGLPAGGRAAGRVRAAVAVLLRRIAARRVQHDPWLGRPWARPLAAGRGHGDAVDRHRGHLGGRRRHGDHLPGRAAGRATGAVRRRRGRRRLDLAEDPLHHAAVAAQRAAS